MPIMSRSALVIAVGLFLVIGLVIVQFLPPQRSSALSKPSDSGSASKPVTPDPARIRTYLATQAQMYWSRNQPYVHLDNGWWFLVPEMAFYGQGPFWGESAPPEAQTNHNQDPLKVVLQVHESLKSVGVTLILVPIPGKTLIYLDKLEPSFVNDRRWDEPLQQFFQMLTKNGIEVVDLTEPFFAMRRAGGEVYASQDSHPSPAAYLLAAQEIGKRVRGQAWYAATPTQPKSARRRESVVDVVADLPFMAKAKPQSEKIKVVQTFDGDKTVASDRNSPIVLIGDSHLLKIYPNGGLVDHLFGEIGAVDVVAVAGDGANSPRLTLARRGDNLAGKKCIIWCFAARTLTQSPDGWRMFPLIPPTSRVTSQSAPSASRPTP
ncbi:MAG TPA: hypothetical protein VL282_02500 [Tepidisphaeraceae bacterium]|jgi:hypothetical protein|nr:hypothetical protein [Tepidisphaeraceae bacterium]